MIKVQENISLANYSTMKLGGRARYFVSVSSEDELVEALEFAATKQLAVHILGGGSNTIFTQAGYKGLVIKNDICGIEEKTDGAFLILKIGAGEVWDDVVALSVQQGFCDIAALSVIPGSCGAAPVQNIGAYGQQISGSLLSLRAYDTQTQSFVELTHDECNFSYRHSRFNTTDKQRFIITSITLELHSKTVAPPFYNDIAVYFADHLIDEATVTPLQLREATVAVRVIKLPDPSMVANAGSFFKNPMVSKEQYELLLQTHPQLKAHKTDDGSLKLYGAQLIELAGMKDYHDKTTGMATWKNQALVMVNEHAETTDDLLLFKKKIIAAVQKQFDITLEQEPELL